MSVMTIPFRIGCEPGEGNGDTSADRLPGANSRVQLRKKPDPDRQVANVLGERRRQIAAYSSGSVGLSLAGPLVRKKRSGFQAYLIDSGLAQYPYRQRLSMSDTVAAGETVEAIHKWRNTTENTP